MKLQKLLIVLVVVFGFMGTTTIKGENSPKAPKYVFYFILDGTGINTVLATEMYHAELQGYIGRAPLCMSMFPVVSVASTHSASHPITDSAASGTALATGSKTGNGVLGMLADKETVVHSIAHRAKKSGRRVSVGSSVCINHATPAAFYAHQPSRQDYYDIGKQLPVAGFDFYVASDFNKPKSKLPGHPDLYSIAQDSGYVIARGIDDYYAKASGASRMILFQPEGRDPFSLPYSIDVRPGQMTLPEMVRAQIDFLMRDSLTGFFIMNEIGGKVDFACHANDAATALTEVAAADSAIRIAYDFYLTHPDETLIVITSDHETGGLVLSNKYVGGSKLNLKILAHQRGSQDAFTARLHLLRQETRNNVTWEQVKTALEHHYGFWTEVSLSESEEKELQSVYEKSFKGKMPNEKNLYSENEPLAGTANRIINAKAGLSWATGSHSAGLVPVYAVGVGAERFASHNDNATIPLKIAEIAGYPEF